MEFRIGHVPVYVLMAVKLISIRWHEGNFWLKKRLLPSCAKGSCISAIEYDSEHKHNNHSILALLERALL